MNKNSKNAAVKKYSSLYNANLTGDAGNNNFDDLQAAIEADDKKYNEADVQEIIDAITATPDEEKAPVKHYEKWRVLIKNEKPEKLKKEKDCVKISDEEAEILNAGVIAGAGEGETMGIMYFKKD